jgi:hypothetical protein
VKSLKDLDSRQACETPFEFELQIDGKPAGVKLSVIGQQSETFEKAAAAIASEFELAKSLQSPVDFIQSDQSRVLTARLVAARIVGWTGISEPCTPENALALVSTNQDAFTQVLATSNRVGNFIKL